MGGRWHCSRDSFLAGSFSKKFWAAGICYNNYNGRTFPTTATVRLAAAYRALHSARGSNPLGAPIPRRAAAQWAILAL